MQINTAFELGQKVKVEAHGITGVVNAYWMARGNSLNYEVEYAAAGKIETRFYTESEIIAV